MRIFDTEHVSSTELMYQWHARFPVYHVYVLCICVYARTHVRIYHVAGSAVSWHDYIYIYISGTSIRLCMFGHTSNCDVCMLMTVYTYIHIYIYIYASILYIYIAPARDPKQWEISHIWLSRSPPRPLLSHLSHQPDFQEFECKKYEIAWEVVQKPWIEKKKVANCMRGNEICENRVSISLKIYSQMKTTTLKTRAPAHFFLRICLPPMQFETFCLGIGPRNLGQPSLAF